MRYSLPILKGVSPVPATKQSGKVRVVSREEADSLVGECVEQADGGDEEEPGAEKKEEVVLVVRPGVPGEREQGEADRHGRHFRDRVEKGVAVTAQGVQANEDCRSDAGAADPRERPIHMTSFPFGSVVPRRLNCSNITFCL